MTPHHTAPDALILVGGMGTRLRRVVSDRPKPMAHVAGRPFLEWLLLALRSLGVQRVILCTGDMGEIVEEHFGCGSHWGMVVLYSRDPAPLGTAGAVRHALSQVISERVLVLNGDSYCRIDLNRLYAEHEARGARVSVRLVHSEDCSRYGSVVLDEHGGICAFREKFAQSRAGLINAGVYLLNRDTALAIPEGRAVSMETEFLPSLVGRGLYGLVGDGPFLDIGTPEAYALADAFIAGEMPDQA